MTPSASVATGAVVGAGAVPVWVEATMGGDSAFRIKGVDERSAAELVGKLSALAAELGVLVPRMTINFAPLELSKRWTDGLALPAALAVLGAIGNVRAEDLVRVFSFGDLSVSGTNAMLTRNTRGSAAIAGLAGGLGKDVVVYPAADAAMVGPFLDGKSVAVERVSDASRFFSGHWRPPMAARPVAWPVPPIELSANVERVFEIAGAGGHPVFLTGRGAAGAAKVFRHLLPEPDRRAASEIVAIQSIHQAREMPIPAVELGERPFRAPHGSASEEAMFGRRLNGGFVELGEFTLAHQGVFYLDAAVEMPLRWYRKVIERAGHGTITFTSTLHNQVTLPTEFQLVVGSTFCPCGRTDDPDDHCPACSREVRDAHWANNHDRSAPLDVGALVFEERDGDGTIKLRPRDEADVPRPVRVQTVRRRIQLAVDRQRERGQPSRNAFLSTNEMIAFDDPSRYPIDKSMLDRLGAVKREERLFAVGKLARVSRTVADIAGATKVSAGHVEEAFRFLTMCGGLVW